MQQTKRFIAGVSEQEQLLPPGPLFCNKVWGWGVEVDRKAES
jgi:hypothetical protein